MESEYAQEFNQILITLSKNEEIRKYMLHLIDEQPMPGKVTEGVQRLEIFRNILKSLVTEEIDLLKSFQETESKIPRNSSEHSANNRVFASGWAERLVKTQLSRFYNQSVMEILMSQGQTECFVPHSSDEESNSNCSKYLAGKNHEIKPLYNLLIESYSKGNWIKDIKIPDHPHCSHVIMPIT